MTTVILNVEHRRAHGLVERLVGKRAAPLALSPTMTQRRPGHVEVKRAASGGVLKAAGGKTFRAIASTSAPDRQGDVVEQSGWELSAYRKNPVIAWSHDYSSLPVGRATHVGVERNQLVVEFQLAEMPFGTRCAEMIDAGLLNAVSVGFRPLEWQYIGEGMGRRFIRQELLEVSLVVVPANPEALITPAMAQRSHPAQPRLAARAAELARLRR